MRRYYPRNDLRAAWRFMREHAGYSIPPGRAQCALDLARASLALDLAEHHDQADVRIEDDEPSYTWTGLEDDKKFHEQGGLSLFMVVTVRQGNAEGSASLGGIDVWTHDDPYLAIVRAELAHEALADLARNLDDRPHGSPVAR